MPKLSAYSRYSEDISCIQGQETKGPFPPDCQPWDQHTMAPEPTKWMDGRSGINPRVARRHPSPPRAVSSTSNTPDPVPLDSPDCYGGPWSPAAFGPRGLWWTHPGCVCTLWDRGKVEVVIQDTLLRLCYRQNPPEGQTLPNHPQPHTHTHQKTRLGPEQPASISNRAEAAGVRSAGMREEADQT